MSCPSCYNQTCPEQSPEVTVNEYAITEAATLDITVAQLVPHDPTKRSITIEVSDEGYWLIRCWFVHASTPTDQESLTPPSVPGVGSFMKVTNALGVVTFNVENPTADDWRLCATLVGSVAITDAAIWTA